MGRRVWGKGEVQPQLSQRLMQASVCVINHSESLRRGTIHFYPCSLIPPSYHPVLLLNTVPLSTQSATWLHQNQQEVGGLTKSSKEKGYNLFFRWKGGKKTSNLFRVQRKVTGSLQSWIMDKLQDCRATCREFVSVFRPVCVAERSARVRW